MMKMGEAGEGDVNVVCEVASEACANMVVE